MSTKTDAPTWPYRTNTPPHEAAQGWHRVEMAHVYRRGDRPRREPRRRCGTGDEARPDYTMHTSHD